MVWPIIALCRRRFPGEASRTPPLLQRLLQEVVALEHSLVMRQGRERPMDAIHNLGPGQQLLGQRAGVEIRKALARPGLVDVHRAHAETPGKENPYRFLRPNHPPSAWLAGI